MHWHSVSLTGIPVWFVFASGTDVPRFPDGDSLLPAQYTKSCHHFLLVYSMHSNDVALSAHIATHLLNVPTKLARNGFDAKKGGGFCFSAAIHLKRPSLVGFPPKDPRPQKPHISKAVTSSAVNLRHSSYLPSASCHLLHGTRNSSCCSATWLVSSGKHTCTSIG